MTFAVTKFLASHSETFARHLFRVNAYNQYGLYHDDLIGGFHNSVRPDVAEAYRRLLINEPEQHDLRVFRGLRASQLKIQKKLLPEEEWTTYEEDLTKGHYLKKYLEQIYKEEQEKREFAIIDTE